MTPGNLDSARCDSAVDHLDEPHEVIDRVVNAVAHPHAMAAVGALR
jgi:hypothetical protein